MNTNPNTKIIIKDNLSHDKIIYDDEGKPWVCIVCEDVSGAIWEEYERLQDPLIHQFLSTRSKALNWPSLSLPKQNIFNKFKERFTSSINSIKKGEFIPTIQFQVLQKIISHFPQHRLILADFDSLPDTIEGKNAPVVQTRLDNETIACSTYLLKKGEYDIFFPTNFELLSKMYSQMTTPTKQGKVFTQHEFLKMYADPSKTRTLSGYNPLLEEYENMKFFVS